MIYIGNVHVFVYKWLNAENTIHVIVKSKANVTFIPLNPCLQICPTLHVITLMSEIISYVWMWFLICSAMKQGKERSRMCRSIDLYGFVELHIFLPTLFKWDFLVLPQFYIKLAVLVHLGECVCLAYICLSCPVSAFVCFLHMTSVCFILCSVCRCVSQHCGPIWLSRLVTDVAAGCVVAYTHTHFHSRIYFLYALSCLSAVLMRALLCEGHLLMQDTENKTNNLFLSSARPSQTY